MLLAALVVLCPRTGGAQTPLTLDEAIARTLAANDAVRAAAAARDEARARTDQARAGYLPRVDLIEGWQRGNHPVFVFSSLLAQRRFTAANFALDALNHPDPLSNHRFAVTIEQTIFDGLRTNATVDGARIDEGIAQARSTQTAAELRLGVVAAYGRAFSARTAHETARAAAAAAAEDLRRTEDRRDAGLEAESSVLAMRVHAAEVEARRIRAASEQSIARAALNALMNVPLDDDRPLVEPPLPCAGDLDVETLSAAAVASRPELKEAALMRDRAATLGRIARSGFLPQVVVLGAAEADGDSFADRASAWSAGIEVRWNLFAGGGDAARRREAAAAATRAEAERAGIETAVRLDVREAIARYESAVAREAAARRMVDQARESQRMIRDRYEAGLTPASELLRAAEAVVQADSTRTAAVVDVLVSLAALDRAAGRTSASTDAGGSNAAHPRSATAGHTSEAGVTR
ncbi:MAG TPA: TolC family protein [Vicinamibacterales bacterium]|nr:TolC family protein [Vicinamibacterales bacterium]